jgi:hypothetical protein
MFKLEIKTDNAAFTDDRNEEIARILIEVARKLRNGEEYGSCMDYNGNKAGTFEIEED